MAVKKATQPGKARRIAYQKYNQIKIWPTRRWHLFESLGDGISICGLVIIEAGYKKRKMSWRNADHMHPADDLNYCQSCVRSAMSVHGQNYAPLTKKFKALKKKWDAKIKSATSRKKK